MRNGTNAGGMLYTELLASIAKQMMADKTESVSFLTAETYV